MKKEFFAGLSLILVSACSTIIDGPHQNLTVSTNPAGAKCDLYRKESKDGQEKVIATVEKTPGTTYIDKTRYDIKVLCDKDGYQQATYLNHSGLAGAVWGNIAIGGLIGLGVDAATGSYNMYDDAMNISMVPQENKAADSRSTQVARPVAESYNAPVTSGVADNNSGQANKSEVADVATVLAK